MEVRELKLIKNKDGHGTVNYKICLPTKWVKSLELEKKEKVVIYMQNNAIIIKNKEDFEMEEMIKELKEELLNKEISLIDMDNEVGRITGSTTSLFDAKNDCMEQKSCAYFIYDKEFIGAKNIVVEFEIINEDKEDSAETLVKVTDIWED